MAWIVTRAGKRMPVQILRKDGTGTDPGDTFAQGVHQPHFVVCPYADRHRGARVRRVVAAAMPAPPPAREMSAEKLKAATDYYRALKAPGPRQRERLAELETETDRRVVMALPPRTVEDWSNQ